MATEIKTPTFIHLRAHSAYSLAEGALHIKQMAVLAKEAGMPALAMTDSGNLFGALEFSEVLADKGIQPIIGCSLRVETHAAAVEATTKPQPHSKKLPPLVLLAKDETGYRNLMKLSSRAYLQTPENELPHATWEMLEELGGGLICLSGGPDGPIDEALVQGQEPLARQLAERLKRLFGDRFYIELQRHGTEAERAAEVGLVELAYELEV
ncbi:MAG TPA: PHP domain-containing protein, partial [Aestuariivirga sp.]|nr:PHP domain-containing protein [Aestuariivirga sp.]